MAAPKSRCACGRWSGSFRCSRSEVLDQEVIKSLPGFRKRMRWFIDNRQDLARHVTYMERTAKPGQPGEEIRLLAIPSQRTADPRAALRAR